MNEHLKGMRSWKCTFQVSNWLILAHPPCKQIIVQTSTDDDAWLSHMRWVTLAAWYCQLWICLYDSVVEYTLILRWSSPMATYFLSGETAMQVGVPGMCANKTLPTMPSQWHEYSCPCLQWIHHQLPQIVPLSPPHHSSSWGMTLEALMMHRLSSWLDTALASSLQPSITSTIRCLVDRQVCHHMSALLPSLHTLQHNLHHSLCISFETLAAFRYTQRWIHQNSMRRWHPWSAVNPLIPCWCASYLLPSSSTMLPLDSNTLTFPLLLDTLSLPKFTSSITFPSLSICDHLVSQGMHQQPFILSYFHWINCFFQIDALEEGPIASLLTVQAQHTVLTCSHCQGSLHCHRRPHAFECPINSPTVNQTTYSEWIHPLLSSPIQTFPFPPHRQSLACHPASMPRSLIAPPNTAYSPQILFDLWS